MKTKLNCLLLVIALIFTVFPPFAFSENQNPSSTPELKSIDKLIEKLTAERDRTINEAETAKSDLENLQKVSASEPEITAQRNKLEIAQKNANSIQQQLVAITKAQTALSNQDPIYTLIGELKNSLKNFPANGNESEKKQRASIEEKIQKLEKLNSTEDSSLLDVAILASLGILGLGITVFFIWINKKITGSAIKSETDNEATARVRLAKLVTLGAMAFIVIVSVVTLLFAGIKAATAPQGSEDMKTFFDITKWVLATVLPVIAAWVGGVMAYYFGKENFNAGAENAQKLLKEFKSTEELKLETLKAGESGLEIDKAAVYRIPDGSNLEDVSLDLLRNAFTKDGKNYERLPILDNKGCVRACLHMATLTKYLSSLKNGEKADPAKMTFGALAKKLAWDHEKSFDTVSLTDRLISVQTIIKATKECSDVFVTADGTTSKPVIRWITNEDIVNMANQ